MVIIYVCARTCKALHDAGPQVFVRVRLTACISPVSRLYLACISPVSPVGEAERRFVRLGPDK